MLISKVPDEDRDNAESSGLSVENNTHEYQTASELFDFMSKNRNFNTNGDALTQRDLILLYKNIEVGTKLMTNANDIRCVKANQHVETVIYNDDPDSDESDMSEIYSNEDLHNVFLINKERLDLYNNQSSISDTLCPKFGDLEIRTSINSEYDKHFLFNDPFIKEQLKSFNLLTTTNQIDGTILPASLLDFVGCKRLEDNYNFYMDNIIRYVKNTIEHLKRISNGDYLTDKAKQKWREVEDITFTTRNATKVLATSTSIPLHVECKVGGTLSTWNDIVHSAVDIRSLSKILEKKIIVEIPKLICGSYKFLSKCCRDNLIISCRKDQEETEDSTVSRVDVMFQVKRSKTGQVMSNINSVMILQSVSTLQDKPFSLTCKENKTEDFAINPYWSCAKVIKINTSENNNFSTEIVNNNNRDFEEAISEKSVYFTGDDNGNIFDNYQNTRPKYNGVASSSDGAIQIAHRETFFDVGSEAYRMPIQNISLQSVLAEESSENVFQPTQLRKKSPNVRIKSPYENKSYIMEEKKRRKLLEIRDRRERKKMALAENCKITKHKYGKGAVMPQPSSSVTKLSITNKSFYNSIYGQNANTELKELKTRHRNWVGAKNEIIEVNFDNLKCEEETPSLTPVNDSKKFINRSYYLDDTETEMMFVNMKLEEEDEEDKEKVKCSVSNSSEFGINMKILSQLIAPCESELNVIKEHLDAKLNVIKEHLEANISSDKADVQLLNSPNSGETTQNVGRQELIACQTPLNTVPVNMPNIISSSNNELMKITPSVECRKSIDKIYQLMKGLENCKGFDDGSERNATNVTGVAVGRESISIQGSDSGTSLKHHLTSSNPSSFSFDKNNNNDVGKPYDKVPKNVVSKVIISCKSQISKTGGDHAERENNRVISSANKVQEHPLKAISQLLHEFEHVQKSRARSGPLQKLVKKTDTATSNERKNILRQGAYKRQSRLEQHTNSMNRHNRTAMSSKDAKTRPLQLGTDSIKNSYRQVPIDQRYADKNNKKINSDISDEAKEARGEAVRGPSKFTSRLNSLAQPKRIYVQAHSEEYQTRYGKNLITDRLQRLAAASPPPSLVEKTVGPTNSRNKAKRSSNELSLTAPLKFQQGLPIERQAVKPRHQQFRNSSPEGKAKIYAELGHSAIPDNISESAETLKNKMVAVESYVKNHYRQSLFSAVPSELQYTRKTRTPLIPTDIDIASPLSSLSSKESTEIGTKLHHIINSIVKAPLPNLEVLDECYEINSQSSNNPPRNYEDTSLDSDNTRETIDDRVQISTDDTDNTSKAPTTRVQGLNCTLNNKTPRFTEKVPQKDWRALCCSLPMGTFGTRENNYSSSSTQNLYLLQSCEAGSLMVKASLSQTEGLLDLRAIPLLAKPSLNWSFTNIPMQITTVGYAFPEYSNLRCGSSSLCKLIEDISNPITHKSETKKSATERERLIIDNLQKDNPDRQQQTSISTVAPDDGANVAALNKDQYWKTHVKEPESEQSQQVILESVIENKDLKTVKLEEQMKTVSEEQSSNTDYSTSLDILLGLLNEIKKITTCQTQITKSEHESMEMETILNKSLLESSIQSSTFDALSYEYENEFSITSLEKLRCLESNQSMYSYYLSGTDRVGTYDITKPDVNPWCDTKNAYYKPMSADKEINVDIVEKKCVNALTDSQSMYFPITIDHSTNMNDSFIKVFSQSSTDSLFFTDFHSTTSNQSSSKLTDFNVSTKQMIELPKITNKKEINLIIACNENKLKTIKRLPLKTFKQKRTNDKHVQRKINDLCLKVSDFDPVMKMKRDILVTVYSVLVLTVFAALSFPEVLYHV